MESCQLSVNVDPEILAISLVNTMSREDLLAFLCEIDSQMSDEEFTKDLINNRLRDLAENGSHHVIMGLDENKVPRVDDVVFSS